MNAPRPALVLSFYLQLFLALPGLGQGLQLLSLSLLLLQAAWLSARRPRPAGAAPSPLALLLICLIPLQSLLVNVAAPDPYLAQYALLFLLVALAIHTILQHLPFRAVLDSCALAGVAIVSTLLALSAGELRQALSLHIDLAAGLTRYSPLGLHPNLVGHICGGYALLFFGYFLHWQARTAARLACLLLGGVSLLLCVATSSRGGTLAACAAMATLLALAVRGDPRRRRRWLLGGAALAVLGALLLDWSALLRYLGTMLAFDNDYRGLDSGLSGRTDNWRRLLAGWLGSPQAILAGHGLRSGSEELLGYNIDSGYLTLLYEQGLVSTVLLLAGMLAGLLQLFAGLRRQASLVGAVALGLLIFILLESVVARYLLSLGNPVSLLLLYCLIGLPSILRPDGARRAAGAPLWSQA